MEHDTGLADSSLVDGRFAFGIGLGLLVGVCGVCVALDWIRIIWAFFDLGSCFPSLSRMVFSECGGLQYTAPRDVCWSLKGVFELRPVVSCDCISIGCLIGGWLLGLDLELSDECWLGAASDLVRR